ncbi:MAG: ribosome-associated translation inhibitor RaiA [Fimbriimonadales bacterium]
MSNTRRKQVEISDVTFRSPHQELSESEKTYVRKKLQKLARFFHKIWSIEVVYELLRGQHYVTVHVDADGHQFYIKEHQPEFRAAVDAVVQSLEHQLARYKERLQKGRGRNAREEQAFPEVTALAETEEEETDTGPTIRTTRRLSLKPMSVEEALEQAALEDTPFYIFHDADTNRVCVLSRHGDGVYDLIEVLS